MKKKLLVIVLLNLAALVLFSCLKADHLRSTRLDNTSQEKLGASGVIIEYIEGNRFLMVVNNEWSDDSSGATWYYSTGFSNIKLGTSLSVLHNVHLIKASPESKYMAVLSEGEGHPWLEVIDLQLLIEKKQYNVVYEVEPYPSYWVFPKEWVDGNLIIESDMLISRKTVKSERTGECLNFRGDLQDFSWSPESGNITPLTAGARDPVNYFADKLDSSISHQRIQGACALVELEAISKLPLLQVAYKEETDDYTRGVLESAIKDLKSKQKSKEE